MPLGNVSDLRANDERAEQEDGGVYRALLESTGQGYCTIEVALDENEKPVDYLFLQVSPTFERQTGIKNGAGRWMREIAPDQDQFWFDVYGRVALTGEPTQFENFSTPLDRWFSVYALKVDGPRRVAVLFDDITERKRAEAALVASKEQFETLLNQAPLGVYLVDGDFVIREVNPIAIPVFGDIPGGAVGRDFNEIIHKLWDKEYADEVVRIFRHTLETGEAYVTPERSEYRVDRDIIEYYEWRLDRIPLPGGQYGVVCYFRDISAQVKARKEMETARASAREIEERQAYLLKLSDALRSIADPLEIQVVAMHVLGEQLQIVGAQYYESDDDGEHFSSFGGYTDGSVAKVDRVRLDDFGPFTKEAYRAGRTLVVDDVWHDDRITPEQAAAYKALGVCAYVGVPLIKAGRLVVALGAVDSAPKRWTKEETALIEETAQRTWAAVERAHAEAALRESERYKGLLLAELQHRVRNILAMVGSVVRRTADNYEDIDDYVRHLGGRLSALARVQAILTREPGRGVYLRDMVVDELRSQGILDAQFQIEGPEVALSSKAAELLSLAVHELATNSTKYGLSSDLNGTIRIRWAVNDRDGGDWLRFTWNEPVDRKVVGPSRTGFGTELIRKRVPYELRGTGEIRFGGGEVEVEIDFPLADGTSNLTTPAEDIGQ